MKHFVDGKEVETVNGCEIHLEFGLSKEEFKSSVALIGKTKLTEHESKRVINIMKKRLNDD